MRNSTMFPRANQYPCDRTCWALWLVFYKKERGRREGVREWRGGRRGGRRKPQIQLPNFCMTQPHHCTILMVHELGLRRVINFRVTVQSSSVVSSKLAVRLRGNLSQRSKVVLPADGRPHVNLRRRQQTLVPGTVTVSTPRKWRRQLFGKTLLPVTGYFFTYVGRFRPWRIEGIKGGREEEEGGRQRAGHLTEMG